MTLTLIRPENITEDLLLPATKHCETLILQNHARPEETLEFKMIRSSETFHFNPLNQVEGDWMLGLVDLEIYTSLFNITEDINKFELYIFPEETSGGASNEKVRDETWIFRILQPLI